MSDEKTKQRYTGEAGRQYHQKKRSIPAQAEPWLARLRAEKLREQITTQDVGLEYGVGFGWNLAALTCARKIGFDLTESLGPGLEDKGIRFISDTASIENNSIDSVIWHHTLEHVLHPATV